MRKIIHHVRKQPEHVRRHILHVLTIVAGAILFTLWIYSLSRSLTNPETRIQAKNDLEPLSVLKDNLANGYNSISQPETQQ